MADTVATRQNCSGWPSLSDSTAAGPCWLAPFARSTDVLTLNTFDLLTEPRVRVYDPLVIHVFDHPVLLVFDPLTDLVFDPLDSYLTLMTTV